MKKGQTIDETAPQRIGTLLEFSATDKDGKNPRHIIIMITKEGTAAADLRTAVEAEHNAILTVCKYYGMVKGERFREIIEASQ